MAPRSCPLDSFLDASPPRTPFLCRSYRYLHAGRVRFGAGSGRASSEKARSDRRHSTVTENLSTRLVEHYLNPPARSEEHTSEPQSLMRNPYAVFCLKKKKTKHTTSI